MKVLHVADIHCSKTQLEWVVKESVRFDLVAIAGDVLDLNPVCPFVGQLDLVMDHLRRVRRPLMVCSGNHDSMPGGPDAFFQAQWIQGLKGPKTWVDGQAFSTGGWSFRCVGWNAPLPLDIAEDCWVIHGPPSRAKTAIAVGGINFGDDLFRDLCESGNGPWVALSGHIHSPQCWWAKVGRTWSLNPGNSERGGVPRHIALDLSRGVAALCDATGAIDTVQLTR